MSTTTQSRRTVHFATVSVREYALTLGDSPSTTCGPPTTLSWSYSCPSELNNLSLEDYEAIRHPINEKRRTRRQLKMSVEERRDILSRSSGRSSGCPSGCVARSTSTTAATTDQTISSTVGSEHEEHPITPELIAKAERKVERHRRRQEKKRREYYASDMTIESTYFPRRASGAGIKRVGSYPPGRCHSPSSSSSCSSTTGGDISSSSGGSSGSSCTSSATWDMLLSTLLDSSTTATNGGLHDGAAAAAAYLKAAEHKAELLREEYKMKSSRLAAQASQQTTAAGGANGSAREEKMVRASKQRSFSSRAA